MSLAQHVTAIEGVDREPDDAAPADVHRAIRHVLSYDVLAPPTQEVPDKPFEPAYKSSPAQRITQVAVAVLACWFASGIVFGFAALKPILIAEGVYAGLCADDEFVEAGEACVNQDIRLNFFFTIASITTNVSALPVGTLVDNYGRRAGYLLGCVALLIGSLLMGFAFAITEFDGYLLGNVFLALGGTLLFVPSFQLAYAFPKYSGVIVALITGAFDASAAVFLLYGIVYEKTNGAFRPQHFFFAYAIVPCVILLAEFAVMPANDYYTSSQLEQKLEKAQDPSRDVHESDDDIDSDSELYRVRSIRASRRQRKMSMIEDLVGDELERARAAAKEEERQANSGVWGVFHGQPAYRQVQSLWFILILLLTVLQMLRMNYFIATIDTQYYFMLGRAEAERIKIFFDFALPIGGVISTPFIGLLLDGLSVSSVLGVITVLITLVGVFNCLPFVWAGYVTVVLFVLMRPLYYSAMSDYVTKVFGFATFGRIYGTIICLSGLVNFSQSGLDALTLGPLGGNPTSVNAALTVAAWVIGTALTVYVWVEGRGMSRGKDSYGVESEAGERERLLSVAEEEGSGSD